MFNSYKEAPQFVKTFIDTTIKHEGGDKYTNIKEDSGGETRYGVTKKATLKYTKHFHLYNWDGNMKTLPLAFAQDLYAHEYFMIPKFNLVAEVSQMIAEELFDTGINTHPRTPSKWLQQLLNVLNNQQEYYKDILDDGFIGKNTVIALKAYLNKRGNEGEKVLHNMLNTLQGNHYIQLAIKREKDEKFVYGQFNGRVSFK
jgi:typhoid toxin secretion A